MRSRFWLLLGLSLVMLMALAGNVLAQDMTGDFEVVQAAAQAYLSSDKPPTMSADALWENLSDGDPDNDPFILSVRSPQHYEIGHIPGAININITDRFTNISPD